MLDTSFRLCYSSQGVNVNENIYIVNGDICMKVYGNTPIGQVRKMETKIELAYLYDFYGELLRP